MDSDATRQKFAAALDSLVAQIQADRTVLAALLCGSLSHDAVWAKSDIDLVLITADDKKPDYGSVSLDAAGVNVHACLIARAAFRRMVEGTTASSFMHSFLAKGRLLYTHDETIAGLCAKLHDVGARDTRLQVLRSATAIVPSLDKATKWLLTRGDLDYTALWLLYAATPLAQVEVLNAGLLVDREVLPQAAKLNPALFKVVYTDLLNTKKTRKNVQAALDAVSAYVADRATTLFAPILDYLRDAGEARSCTEIEDHFQKHCDVGGATLACEYLAARGLIGRASTPVRLTKKSNVQVQELAFFATEGPADG